MLLVLLFMQAPDTSGLDDHCFVPRSGTCMIRYAPNVHERTGLVHQGQRQGGMQGPGPPMNVKFALIFFKFK